MRYEWQEEGTDIWVDVEADDIYMARDKAIWLVMGEEDSHTYDFTLTIKGESTCISWDVSYIP